jgi:MFS transporter, DHA1 family, multidrug resistance protein
MVGRIGPEQRAILGLALIAAFAEAAYAVVNVLALPVFVERELRATHWLGTIVGSFLLVETLLKGPMGAASDRVGRRLVLIAAPLVSALAAAALTVVHPPVDLRTLGYLIAVRSLDGAAAAAFWMSMFAAVADQAPVERRSAAMSTLTVSYLIGLAVGPWLGGVATKLHSVRAAFFLVAALFILTSAAALALAPRRVHHPEVHAEHGESVGVSGLMESLRRAPQFMLMAVAVFLAVGLLIPTATLIALALFGLDEEQYGRLFMIPAVVIGVLTLPLGRMGDTWGKSRSVHVGLGIAALSLWALALMPKTQLLLVLGASALGIGVVMGLPAWVALVSELADPRYRGTILGAVGTAQGLGGFLGVIVGPRLFVATDLADRLRPMWPGPTLVPQLLPVIGAAVVLTFTWMASLVVVHERKRVGT